MNSFLFLLVFSLIFPIYEFYSFFVSFSIFNNSICFNNELLIYYRIKMKAFSLYFVTICTSFSAYTCHVRGIFKSSPVNCPFKTSSCGAKFVTLFVSQAERGWLRYVKRMRQKMCIDNFLYIFLFLFAVRETRLFRVLKEIILYIRSKLVASLDSCICII